MPNASEVHKGIPALLRSFGIHPEPGSVRRADGGITFRFKQPDEARKILHNRNLFAQGRLGILHSREVGRLLTEFRSYRNGAGHSLHIVVDQDGSAYADLDRFNPYQSAHHMVLHGALELLPHLTKRLLKSCQRITASLARLAARSRGVQRENRP